MSATLSLSAPQRRLAPREKLFLGTGGGCVAAFALYFLMPSGEAPSVQLATAPSAAVPVSAAPAPVPSLVQVPAAPAPTVASVDGLMLKGVSGGGPRGGSAFMHLPSGQQRMVPIGRDVLPGLTLKTVGISHVILAGAGGEIRLDLGRSGASQAGAAKPAGAASAQQAGWSGPTSREAIGYRLGLQPVQQDGRVAGYAVKAGAAMPRLQKAGLQADDVIVSVNGSRFDEERMMELSWQAANSAATEIEFIRNGQRMKASIGGK